MDPAYGTRKRFTITGRKQGELLLYEPDNTDEAKWENEIHETNESTGDTRDENVVVIQLSSEKAGALPF